MSQPYYLISFDCESTGLSCERDQIVEFGAVIWFVDTMKTCREIGTFCQYVKPTVATMSRGASLVTGITMVQLRDMPPIRQVLDNFATYMATICNDDTIPRILLSYNGFHYDIPLIVHELERGCSSSALSYFRSLKIERALDVLPFGRAHLDKTCLKRRVDGGCSYRLGDVYTALCHQDLAGAHGALVDSRAVLEIVASTDIIEIFLTTIGKHTDKICCSPMDIVQACLQKTVKKGSLTSSTNTIKHMLMRKRKRMEMTS